MERNRCKLCGRFVGLDEVKTNKVKTERVYEGFGASYDYFYHVDCCKILNGEIKREPPRANGN